jgi:hypothetical protein
MMFWVAYLTLPLALPILLAIFFRFFCHSGFVKSRLRPIELDLRAEEPFPFEPGQLLVVDLRGVDMQGLASLFSIEGEMCYSAAVRQFEE